MTKAKYTTLSLEVQFCFLQKEAISKISFPPRKD
jgi:hypothetical protein